jgi:hypothetical protein
VVSLSGLYSRILLGSEHMPVLNTNAYSFRLEAVKCHGLLLGYCIWTLSATCDLLEET